MYPLYRTVYFVLFFMAAFQMIAKGSPVELKCEGQVDPAGVDALRPHLGWNLLPDDEGERGTKQVAYRILVASSSESLAGGRADLWDSGRVESSRCVDIEYAGNPLESVQRVYWKVQVWDSAKREATESKVATWIMGMLSPADWKAAKWITADEARLGPGDPDGEAANDPRPVGRDMTAQMAADFEKRKDPVPAPSILLRKEFVAKPSIQQAVICVTGLGHFELHINGNKIGRNIMSPGWTEYRQTVLYETFDVTQSLREGKNAIGLIVGNGMYNVQYTRGRYVKFVNVYGALKAIACLRITYSDGTTQTLATDETWKSGPSPITFANVFGGEDYDQRREIVGWDLPDLKDEENWKPVVVANSPGGALRGISESAPPLREIESHKPVKVSTLRPGVFVYDLGQNASHMPRIVARGPAGSKIRIVPSEVLGPNGDIDRASCIQNLGGPAWWQYTFDGRKSQSLFPRFFYQGCRYLRVELIAADGNPELPTIEQLEGVVVHSSAEPIGSFECSNTLFSRIYALVRWAQRSNMMSVMTDCPAREKLGWLEELHLNGPSLRYNFDLSRFSHKVTRDMAQSQEQSGFVPNIAPEFFMAAPRRSTEFKFRNSPEWGSSIIIVPWQQFLFNGDRQLLERHYDAMVRYVGFLRSEAKDDVISIGLGDWYDLGPKPPWGSQLTPEPFTATAIYYHDLSIMAQVAQLLNKPNDAARFNAEAERVKDKFHRHFYDAAKKQYATGSQCTSAMVLVLGLVPEEHRSEILDCLISDIRAHGNALTAGDVGYRFVLRALADAGRSDVVFDMNNQSDRPGYGMQLARGATSLTEKWDASVGSFGSHNHFMLGQINEWFFHDLAGIQPDLSAPGFETFNIKPAIVGDITWLKCGYKSPYGMIHVEWSRNDQSLSLNVTIPPNSTATIFLPTTDFNRVAEAGRLLSEGTTKIPGILSLKNQPGLAVICAGSGTWHFTGPWKASR